MGYSLNTSEAESETVLKKRAYAFKLTVTSDDETIYPTKVFVMQKPDEDGEPWFNCVAGLVELTDLPEDSPGPPVDGVYKPYFRLSEITVISRTPKGISDFVSKVESMLESLENDIEALIELEGN